ncbi:MAG: carboxypeptidase regulatory-like domain-containing protein [Thermoplasmatota archaeon]
MFGRSGKVYLLLSLLLIATLSVVPSEDTGGFPVIDSGIYGTIKDLRTGEPISNLTVSFSADFFDTEVVITNSTGGFQAVLPSKVYTLSVYSSTGGLLNRTVHVLESGQWLNIHLNVDPSKPLKATISGKVLDSDDEPLENANVLLTRRTDQYICCNLTTDKDGEFKAVVEPGVYLIEIFHDGKVAHEEVWNFKLGKEYEVEISTNISVTKPLLTLEDVRDFLSEEWLSILVLLLIVLFILISYLIILALLGVFKKRKVKFLETDWFTATRRFVTRMAILGIFVIISWRVSLMFPSVEEYLWGWMKQLAGPAAGVIATLFISRMLLLANTNLWDWFRERRGGGKALPSQFISYFSIIIRYVIIIISGVVIVVLGMIAFGLREQIWSVASDFLSKNAGKLGFLVVLIIAAFFIRKFVALFFKELGTRSKRMSPEIVSMTQKGATGLVYFVIILIFLYTLLSIGGLGDIGTTFILVISMIIGLVVSFAATGSIGNMLSGLVLMSMKPYDTGDRVMIGETIGFVEKLGIMFTTIKDLESRFIEIPNNTVLANNIMNFSRSAKEGGYAVVIDVGLGYDLSPKTVRPLLKRAALTSPGVLKDPVPKVIVREFLDHAVVYRLRAYIDDPTNMLFIRSSVMESTLMIFHEEGLEVMSPLQHVKVEGKEPTKEELMLRAHPEQKNTEAAAGGLMMFDALGDKQ